MPQLDRAVLDRIRRDNPDFDRDHALIEAVARDCAIAYFWNPYVDAREFAYLGWSTTLYAGVDDATRTAHIVFRGTDQLIDWVLNFACVPLPLDHPWAHSGFVGAWKLAKRRLLPWLREESGRFDRVIVGGHSLGGALALACAYELHDEGFNVERCVTVGAPRVYMFWSVKRVEAALGNRLIRVCRQQDLVPKVPPAWLGYRHIGAPWLYVAEIFGQRVAEPFPRLGQWLDRAWSIFGGGRVGDGLARLGVAREVQTQLVVYALSLFAGLGAVATLFVQVSVGSLFGATLLFLLVSGALIALQAHRSGHYAATRKAASLVEEWQIHCLRGIARGKKLEPAAEDSVWVDLSVALRGNFDDRHRRRLVDAFARFFGGAPFQTVLGRSLDQALTAEAAKVTARQYPATAATRKLDAQFKRACLSLLLYGYSSEEIDRMLDDGVIARPKRWSRYYVEFSPGRARGRAGRPDPPAARHES